MLFYPPALWTEVHVFHRILMLISLLSIILHELKFAIGSHCNSHSSFLIFFFSSFCESPPSTSLDRGHRRLCVFVGLLCFVQAGPIIEMVTQLSRGSQSVKFVFCVWVNMLKVIGWRQAVANTILNNSSFCLLMVTFATWQ